MSLQELETDILLLKHELHQVQIINNNLDLSNRKLVEENALLRRENLLLKTKINSLEDKLNINSSNSGLPSSKDVYKIERKSKRRSTLKPGGQLGQKPRSFEFKVPDKVINVVPAQSECCCGGDLVLAADYKAHQKIEIPQIKPFVTEYRLRTSVCSKCDKKYSGKLENYKLLGKNAESIITSLGGFFNNSKRDIQSILKQIFNLDISLGLVSKSEERVSAKLEVKYKELHEKVENSKFLHLDETSCNNKGKRGWCWVAASKDVTLFKLTNSRGKKVLEDFLPEYTGKVITDRYAVYNIFAEDNRQVCLAHLRRDFKRFAHSKEQSLSKMGLSLVKLIDLVFDTHRVFKNEKIDKLYYLRRMRKIKKKMNKYLKIVANLSQCRQAARVAGNVLKSFDMMWTFVNYPEIEPTNNFAERQIKHQVKYRKNSFFTWSARGDRFIERAKSIFASAKLQNLNPFLELQALL